MKALKSSVSNIVASLALVGGLALVSGNNANAVSFNYANRAGASISFSGGGFGFTPVANNFEVTSGSANTFLGEFTGSFAIGTVTTSFGVSSAPVTGTGTMVIHDPADGNLTANLTWIDIQQIGAGGSLNTIGAVNLTGITYTGSNADLLALATDGSGGNVLSFQFATVISLADLKSGGGATTSFSGTINSTSVPDGGLTVGLLGLALVGLSVVRLTLKKATA